MKIIRVVWSLLILLVFISIFVIADNNIPAADWQLTPSAVSIIVLFSVFSIFLFFVVETLLFGRIYCSFTCPLGVVQDIAIRVGKLFRINKKRKLFTRNRRVLRYSILVLFLGSLLFGAAIPLGLLEPFATFGRFITSFVKPAFNWFNNLLVDNAVFENLYPLKDQPFSLLLLITGGSIMFIVMGAAAVYGRIFCNTLCPVGAILGILSKFSWFRVTIRQDACTKCGKCAKVCKANCIDIKNNAVDTERCVSCFNCTAACSFKAINYKPEKHAISKPDFSRRDFITIGGSAVIGAAIVPSILRSKPSSNAVMPPGAIDFGRFTSKCTGCQLCVSNCPGHVIKPAALQYGLSGFLQPRLDFDSGMCEFECTICSNICPNNALIPLTVERKKLLQLGLARYYKKRCVVVTDRTHCGACAEHCPTGAVYMDDWEEGLTIPKVKPELCIGCGACEFICPVRPDKAIIVSGLTKQTKAKSGSYKQVKDHLKGKDFPF